MNTIKYILILFFGTLISYGQQMPNVVPPSPEAASAFKFTEMPVSLYTGLPNISIPLFEIESGGVTVPISISYHARGVQVAEIAPRMGIGWALNCGGMVTKQVRDKDDDLNYGCVDYSDFFSSYDSRVETVATSSFNYGESCDMIPDLYSFSVNGMSGKVMRDLIGNAWITQQYSNIIMSPPYNMTDDKGNAYYFGENGATDKDMAEENNAIHGNGTVTPSSPNGATNFPNTWHLTRIKTATGTEIKYYYSNETTYFHKRSNDKGFGVDAVSNDAYIRSDQQRIDSITFDKGRLKFEYSQTDREDMPGSYSLSKITLFDIFGVKIKQAIFDYEYTTSTDYNNINNILANDEESFKRLFLKSVQFADKDGNTLPPYQFVYNPTVLPSRHSNSVDVWGYYNGKNNGNFLETYFDDRSVDVEKVQAGLLQTMIKPEGGLVNFYYEPNIAVNVFPDTVFLGKPNPSYHNTVTLSQLDANLSSIDPETNTTRYNGSGNYSDVFIVSEFQTGSITATANGLGIVGCNCGGAPGCSQNLAYTCQFSLTIQKFNLSTSTFDNYLVLHQGTRSIILPAGKYKLKVTYTGAGSYTTTGTNSSLLDHNKDFIVSITWDEEIASTFLPELMTPSEIPCTSENLNGNKVIHAAGNRIRKIEYKDSPQATSALIKTYSYTNPDTGQTSGRLLGLTNFVSVSADSINGQPANAGTEPFGSGGGSQFSTYQGNNVGYKYVTEYYGETNNTIGKTEYEYSMIYDTGRYYEFPYHPSTDNEWLRGKELNVKVYKKQGNSYQLIRKTQNTYLLGDSLEFSSPLTTPICDHPFFKPSVRIPFTENMLPSGGYVKNKRYYTIPLNMIPVKLPTDGEYDASGYETYYMTGGTIDLKKTVTTEYFDNGSELVNTNDYSYRYDNHYNVAQESHAASDATQPLVTKYFYASDPEMAGKSARTDLLAKNMKQVPLVTQSFRGTTKLSETETAFKNWNTTANILEPEFVKTAKGTAATENRLQYVKRNPIDGNILEIKQTSGISISYIWGYGSKYPIAKIENAAYTAVSSYASALQVASNSGTLTQASFTSLRSGLPNATITTYTYNPLIGVTSITDPKGDTITYEYDPFGRLKFVKDKYQNVLSENEYHYGQ